MTFVEHENCCGYCNRHDPEENRWVEVPKEYWDKDYLTKFAMEFKKEKGIDFNATEVFLGMKGPFVVCSPTFPSQKLTDVQMCEWHQTREYPLEEYGDLEKDFRNIGKEYVYGLTPRSSGDDPFSYIFDKWFKLTAK